MQDSGAGIQDSGFSFFFRAARADVAESRILNPES
jgi:hypothetical protein